MAAYVWTGGVDGDWAVDGNWDVAGWPTAGDDATINIADTVTLDIDITIANFTMNHANAIFTCEAIFTVTGGVTLTQGTWNAGSYNHQIAGNFYIDAAGFTFEEDTSTITLTTSGALAVPKAGNEFYNLTFSADGVLYGVVTVVVNNDLVVGGELNLFFRSLTVKGNITGGSLSPAGSETIKLGGDMDITTFNCNTSQFWFIEPGKESNIEAYTFYFFKCVEPDKVIRFKNGETVTIDDEFIITGTSGHEVQLRSQVEGQTWSIDNAGNNEAVDFAFVKDSDPVLSNDIDTTNSYDGGNNDVVSPGWIGLIPYGVAGLSTNVSGTWKDVETAEIDVATVKKEIEIISVNVGGVWKAGV